LQLPPGHQAQVVIAWGDPLLAGAARFDPDRTDAAQAARQFGTNNDFIALLPSPDRPHDRDRRLLFANHEYPNPHLMWPGLRAADAAHRMSESQIATAQAAVGASIVELERRRGRWRVRTDSRFNRRVTPTTPMRISGPAAGAAALRTRSDPTARRVLGTLSNCNGGVTPWGTILTCEEGAGWIFGGDWRASATPDRLRRYYYDEPDNDRFGWARIDPRFRLDVEPNEPNRFEWVVEIDPHDPEAMPVKRTALGRFAHEGASVAVAPDGKIVVYLGDDWEFEYCYRFVSSRPWNPSNRAANRDLLDDGVLSVARFDANGAVTWLPLVFGVGPLTVANGFESQADVLINSRRAADLLGATPMDSPEGYVPHPFNGRVYLALTSNSARVRVNAANPRANNRHGHLLELVPPMTPRGADHAAECFDWNVLALCGDPFDRASGARFHPDTGANDWFTDPDNLGFDAAGRLWVCTDGVQQQGHDGLYVMDVDGPERARPHLFMSPPAGAECCSPVFADSGRSLWLAIQHPGEHADSLSCIDTTWPPSDGSAPRSAVIVIMRDDGEPILGGGFDSD
jgi:secreted PhoX family phosphatase